MTQVHGAELGRRDFCIHNEINSAFSDICDVAMRGHSSLVRLVVVLEVTKKRAPSWLR